MNLRISLEGMQLKLSEEMTGLMISRQITVDRVDPVPERLVKHIPLSIRLQIDTEYLALGHDREKAATHRIETLKKFAECEL
jgi:hypothetical protein